jgi:DMSO/TMAO reductase YedYZ heme-binding membrane subunit
MNKIKSKIFIDKSNPVYNQIDIFTFLVKKIILFISVILSLYGYILLSNMNVSYSQEQVFHYIKEMGEWAINALFVVVFAGPLYKLFSDNIYVIKFNLNKVLKFFLDIRPEMGFFMGLMAISHGVFILLSRIKADLFELPLDFSYIGTWAIWSGVLAFIITIPMFLTSNRWAIQKLGPVWFKIHSMIVYLVVFGVFHSEIIGARDGEISGIVSFLIIIGIYFCIKHLANNKK